MEQQQGRPEFKEETLGLCQHAQDAPLLKSAISPYSVNVIIGLLLLAAVLVDRLRGGDAYEPIPDRQGTRT